MKRLTWLVGLSVTLALGCGDGETITGPTTSGPGVGGAGAGGAGAGGGVGGSGGSAAACGDGAVEGSEACDDGNTADGDGCSSTCAVEAGWVCDGSMPSVCTLDCGDGVVIAPEACDDGNAADGDGCSTTCQVETGWLCDDSMPSVCTAECGDGVVAGPETCDDGNVADLDGCSMTCDVELGWDCDTSMPSVCMEVCGDGYVTPSEECDDGALVDGDGCSMACAVESNFNCTGEPSVCVPASAEDCSDTFELQDGFNSVAWTAINQDYITTTPACSASSTYNPDGPDIVMEYTATSTGSLEFVIDKPTNTRWHLLVNDAACGTITNELSCVSEFTNATMGDTLQVTMGTTYYFYLVDSTSGTNPLDNPVTITITPAICGDGLLIGTEACDDGNLTNGDGCDSTCTVETGYICVGEPSVCALAVGDTCANAITLSAGTNTVSWTATGQDYITSAPSCSTTAPNGPDIVMAYTATVTGELDVSIAKPTSTRWHLVVNDATCGTLTPELLCASDFTNTMMGGTISISAGTTYYFYLVDTTSGTNPLDNPVQVDIVETAAICGDGVLTGNEECDDTNTNSGDGCSSTCTIETGYVCSGEPSVCSVPVGDTCANAITLSAGTNTVSWTATGQDYITSAPSCSTTAPNGPDIVMAYTATVTGELDVSIAKPTSTRWHLVVNDATCGTLTPELLCASDFTNATMGGTIVVTSGTTYYFYLVDSTSGTNPLDNPVQVDIVETAQVCGDGFVFGTEECDDTNTTDGDGCSMSCTIESGYVCNGEPSVCIVPPCFPGTNGMVGNTVSMMATDLPTSMAEYYMAADSNAAGYIYIGGTADIRRVPKAGGASDDVEALAGLTTTNLGYTMLIDGLDIYTVDAKETGTTGYIWRISSDGGATWSVTDYATLPGVPNDYLRGITVDNGSIFAITHEFTTTVDTQVFSMLAGGSPPEAASLATTFSNEGRCAALAMDDFFYYTACGTNDRLIRVDRTTGAVTLLTDAFNLDLTANAVVADDVDSDGAADYLYFKGGVRQIGYVCDPAGASPYVDELITYGTSTTTTSYGLAFDPGTGLLYAFDDATEEIIIVQ